MSGSGMNAAAASNRILVVDDEEIVLSTLRETLRRQNFDVVATTDPAAALQELHGNPFAVVIADQRMPGHQRPGIARPCPPDPARRHTHPHRRRCVSLDTVIDAINKGEIYRFIVKPWLREELLVTVKNAVQRHELVQQNTHLQSATQTMNGQLVELNRSLEEQVKLVARQNQHLARAEPDARTKPRSAPWNFPCTRIADVLSAARQPEPPGGAALPRNGAGAHLPARGAPRAGKRRVAARHRAGRRAAVAHPALAGKSAAR